MPGGGRDRLPLGQVAGRTDVRQKIDEYFAIGVEQVWIVEPENRLVVVYSSATTATRYAEEDVLQGAGAGFQSTVGDLFV